MKNNRGYEAAKDAAILLKRELKGNLVSVILYGSLAKKKEFVDIDLLIITRRRIGSIYETNRMLSRNVFGRLFGKYGMLFSYIVFSHDQFAEMRGKSPLLDEIERHGVILHGRQIFEKGAG